MNYLFTDKEGHGAYYLQNFTDYVYQREKFIQISRDRHAVISHTKLNLIKDAQFWKTLNFKFLI
jgi:hypothetical protein